MLRIIMPTAHLVIPPDPPAVQVGSCVAAVGATMPGICGLPIGLGSNLRIGTTTTVSVAPGTDNFKLGRLYSFTLGGLGAKPPGAKFLKF